MYAYAPYICVHKILTPKNTISKKKKKNQFFFSNSKYPHFLKNSRRTIKFTVCFRIKTKDLSIKLSHKPTFFYFWWFWQKVREKYPGQLFISKKKSQILISPPTFSTHYFKEKRSSVKTNIWCKNKKNYYLHFIARLLFFHYSVFVDWKLININSNVFY